MSNPTHFVLEDSGELNLVYPEGYQYEKLLRIPSGYWNASEADRDEINARAREFMHYLRGKLHYL